MLSISSRRFDIAGNGQRFDLTAKNRFNDNNIKSFSINLTKTLLYFL
jgi:hypothetical protein